MNDNLNENFKKNIQEDINKMTQFNTSDFYLASCLVSMGFSVYRLDKTDPERCQFIFKRNSGLDDAIDKYWENKLKINPKIIFDSQRFLKSRIHSNE